MNGSPRSAYPGSIWRSLAVLGLLGLLLLGLLGLAGVWRWRRGP